MKDCIPWKGPHTGETEEHKEEGLAKTKYYELTLTCIPHPCGLLRGGCRKVRSEAEPGKKISRGVEHLFCEERLGVLVVQSGEERAPVRLYSSLSVLRRGLRGQNL